MNSALRILPALALLALLSPLRADDIIESIDAGKASYEAGDYSEAINSFDFANQLIRQKKGAELKNYLPAAPKGWEAGEAELEAASGSVFGGGITASREYTSGDKRVTIKIQSDSPMMQATMALFDNSMLSGAMEQLPLKGQKAVISFESGDTNGDIKVVVDRRYLVEVSGRSVTRDDVILLAKAFDYAKLAKVK